MIALPKAQKGERLWSSIDPEMCMRAKCRYGMQPRSTSALAKLPASIAMPFAFYNRSASPVLDAVLAGTNRYEIVLTSVNQKTCRRFGSQSRLSRCSPTKRQTTNDERWKTSGQYCPKQEKPSPWSEVPNRIARDD